MEHFTGFSSGCGHTPWNVSVIRVSFLKASSVGPKLLVHIGDSGLPIYCTEQRPNGKL